MNSNVLTYPISYNRPYKAFKRENIRNICFVYLPIFAGRYCFAQKWITFNNKRIKTLDRNWYLQKYQMFSSMLQHVVKFHFRKSIVWYVENVRWCIIYAFMFASHKFVMLEGARKHTYLIRVSAMTYYKIFNSAKNT